jgi:hypothetical protein
MAVLSIKSFGGISPKVPARYLQDSQAQVAINCPVFNGPIQPLPGVSAAVATLTKTGTPQTIYRFGQDLDSDSQYWFHWTTDVDVCRGQISNDTSEWTYFTGDGGPKATYFSIATSGTNQPTVSRPLGIPAPETAVTTSVTAGSSDFTLYSSVISSFSIGDAVEISFDNSTWVAISITTVTATSIASQLDALTDISATADEDGNVVITRTGDNASEIFYVRYQTGTQVDTAGTFTYDANLDKSDTGAADTSAYVIIQDTEIGSISSGDVITITTNSSTAVTYTATGTMTAATLAAALNTTKVTATQYGSCVVFEPGTEGGGSTGYIQYRRTVSGSAVTTEKVDGSEAGMPAMVFITAADFAYLKGNYAEVTVHGLPRYVAVASSAELTSLSTITSYGVTVNFYGSADPVALIRTELAGSTSALRIRAGAYPTGLVYEELDSNDGALSPETRVYTYTFVNKESGFEMESAPAPASSGVNVVIGDVVSLSSFASIPSGVPITHKRIYRSTSGTYLFVAEIPIASASYSDSVDAESLGEPLPSLTWLPPPNDLAGLINLPNGALAGFVGRDIYFSEPYVPYAWPVQYRQSIDFPVVGLGRMDTTLAVLTRGSPYFIQGSHPDSMVVVKSDLEQACVSKRSIVSSNGVVIYASPDGLVMLSPSGSKVITEQYFTRAQWQSYFSPSSIHAYQHDLKYVAFYNHGGAQGGFIYDLTSGQFILHDEYATAGYNDMRNDKLYLAYADRSVKVWYEGAAKSYVWRSKKFSGTSISSFSCAQIEAEVYPITAKFYVDSVLAHTQTVTSRLPFRLPAVAGRDFEVQLEGSTEVFSVSVAQSMQELANV